MNTIKKTIRSSVLGFATTMVVVNPLWADDTDIFFGGKASASSRPNIMFILDTSGSMLDTNSENKTRIDRMKGALTNLLSSVKDVNIGLMRFTDPGGPVLYPIRYVDGKANSLTTSLDGTYTGAITNSSDDAYENANGTIELSSDALVTESGGSVTIQQSTINSADDAEEYTWYDNVGIYDEAFDVMHGYDGKQINGIRFKSLNIPKNATITDAYLEFEVKTQSYGWGIGDVTVDIYGHDTNNASAFQETNWNISSRTKTSAKVEWAITDNPAAGTIVKTSSITPIIQEIVNRGGWKSQNSLALILELKNRESWAWREFYSADGKADSIKLHVSYADGSPTNPTKIGLRFNEIAIPQGATITSAKLNLTALKTDSVSSSIKIYGEDIDHSEAFTSSTQNISTRTKTTANVTTSFSSWDAGDVVSSNDLTSVIQEIVNRPGWCGNNSLSLILEPASNSKKITSFDQNSTATPELLITYDTTSISSTDCMNYKLESLIAEKSDDAEEASNGDMSLNSHDLDLGESTVGLRYTNLPFKQGITVSNAYLEFVSDSASADASTLTISAHDLGDSTAFTTSRKNISNRTPTTATATWAPEFWSQDGHVSRTTNIAPLINEVLENTSWTSGNSMTFMIEGSGHRIAKSANGSVIPPKLVYFVDSDDVSLVETTVRQELIQAVQALPADGATPIVDTLYEARQYFTGGDVVFGKSRGDGYNRHLKRVSSPSTYKDGTLNQPTGCSDSNLDSHNCAEESITGSPVYIAPEASSCQKSHIVLLTDGLANRNHSKSKIKTLLNKSSCESSSSDEQCGLDLVRFMADKEKDQLSNATGNQQINTHVIGLEINTSWLKKLAEAGEGGFHEVESEQEILDVFDTIVSGVLAINSTFVEPSVTVNQFNRFAHRDDIYFSVFKPSKDTQWPGNIKRYQLKGNPATLYDNSSPQAEAIDLLTGYFAIDSKSFWSADIDGKEASAGGAASKLPFTRNIMTNINTSGSTLNIEENKIDPTNTSLTKELLGISGESDSYRTDVINWARGRDENNANRFQIGDPLHSRPELITYDAYSTPINSYIFTGTNEGYLHAFDINTGEEKFAFIPKELLPHLRTFYDNEPSDSTNNPRPYGLDGGLTVWTRDKNYDGDLADSDEFARIYVGMRRGGRSYYALDVTDINNPKQMWSITGGSGSFVDLGQTWSEPVKTKINFNGSVIDVLIFAGGYDVDQDTATTRSTDDMGNAIYIVNAETGALVWSGGNHNGHSEVFSEMDYSIPSDVTVLDMNRDGLADQMYVGDMGGQVWRFDINNEETQLNKFVDGGVIANFADATASGNRRFYYRPDVALIVNEGERYLSVSIGSGFRADPTNTTIQDRFYMLKQYDTHGKPDTYVTNTEANLHNATNNLINEGEPEEKVKAALELSTAEEQKAIDPTNVKKGWYLDLENSGEKVLSASTTILNQVVFTTFEPTPPDTNTCEPKSGTNRIYILDVNTASPTQDNNGDGKVTKADRVVQLSTGSIASTPTVIDTIDSKPTVWVGTERVDQVNTDVDSVRTYWIEESSQ